MSVYKSTDGVLLTPECRVATVYTVNAISSDFIAILKAEDHYSGFIPVDETIEVQLRNLIGVYDVSYNGHYHDVFTYTVDIDEDGPEIHRVIREIISGQILRIRAHKDAD